MNVRRVVAALAGGAAGIFAGALLDIAGYHLELWHYTTPGHPDRASVPIYIGYAILIAIVALIAGRFGSAGRLLFLGFVSVALAVSDFVGSKLGISPQVITGGAVAFVYDVVLWSIVNTIAYAIASAGAASSIPRAASSSGSV